LKTLLQEHDFKLFASKDYLIGIDEVGRGALAGPVVAAACCLHKDGFRNLEFIELTAKFRDSKKMSLAAREKAVDFLNAFKAQGLVSFQVASASVSEINDLNILSASTLAMERALKSVLAGMSRMQNYEVLVDGKPLKGFFCEHQSIIGGDDRSLVIACASILAKVSRDHFMLQQGARYPRYGFENHKGYGTQAHRKSLLENGPCEMHRDLFLRKLFKSG
jgi:ribonuclease HII